MATQNNQDSSSVYYIHLSDASSTQLVSVKFNGTGFNNWKRSMMLTLSAKNKLGFVNGTIETPEATSPDYKVWSRCNDLVISWLIFNLEETIAKSVLFLPTAKEIWSDLEDRFGYASMTQVYSLEQKISDTSQGSQSISEFYTVMKTLWDGVSDANPLPHCTCNKCICNLTQKIQQREQTQKLLQFMMKRNDSYASIKTNLLMMQPLPNLSQAYRLFAQEQRHKELSQSFYATDSLAFAFNRNNNTNFRPSYGAGSGRSYNTSTTKQSFNTGFNGPNTGFNNGLNAGPKKVGNKPGSHYYCTHCKVPGHSIDKCFKIHGYPPHFKENKDKKIAEAFTQTSSDDNQEPDTSEDNSQDFNNIS